SGPLSFLRMYSAATEEVKQGGRRRGANMAVLRIDHPDVLEFISCKDSENTVLVNFNISVGITEEFLDAVRNGTDWDFINPRTKEVTGSMPAQELWDAIAQNAWRMADPGVLFLDEANKYNPTPDIGRLEATNPCGESWLLPNEACTLGSINLAKFAEMSGIMWDNLKLTVRQAVRFLDNTIDASSYATEDIKLMHQGNRKIGL
ncbi:MAG: ribonucleoside-diphosphate reductase, adenosylcobalamin-dependent, partial [Nitrosopumilus sp.]